MAAPPPRSDDVPQQSAEDPSLLADIDALIADGKTYLQAEVAFQKSRAGFAANRVKSSLFYGAAAFALLHLALIALTVGVVIALAPLTGPWLATAIVTAVLVALAVFFVMKLRGRIDEIRTAFESREP